MLGLLLTSFLVVNPLDFSWKECLQSTPQECAQSMMDHSASDVEKFLRPLCEKDHINQACLTLGHFLKLQKKDADAAKVLSKACGYNLGDACVEGGYALERIGQEKKSSDLYLYGCLSLKHAESCQALGVNEKEQGRYLEGYNFLMRSCDLGLASGCLAAADASIFAKKNNNYNLIQIYKKACELSSGLGCLKLGNFFKESNDFNKSSEYFKQACLLDEPEACQYFKELKGGYVERGLQNIKGYFKKFMETFFPLEGPNQ